MPVEGVVEIQKFKRGCGFRYPGLYLFGMGVAVSCDRLPLKIPICPCCGETIRQLRSVRIINPNKMYGKHLVYEVTDEMLENPLTVHKTCDCDIGCPVCHPPEKAGLMWIGERYYPTPKSFIQEARIAGVSKRVPVVPKEIKIGDWVFLAHPNGNELDLDHPERIIYAFQVQQIQRVLTPVQAEDEKFVEKIKQRGYVPVIETGPIIEIPEGE
jgi:hypothetical protein